MFNLLCCLSSISVIIFGALIGYWVDQTTRLRAAQVFLVVQNVMVTICCDTGGHPEAITPDDTA